ncbi:MAG: alpha/beta fold hydrolase [Chloroflexi bacterium]|nr:alpha/beta fold hydrolase [Chloroflexota bacterium]
MLKRLYFPIANALVFAMLFALIGYAIADTGRWALIGVVLGLGLGLAIEAGLGAVGGWLYRRRVTLAVLVEFGLIVAFIGPFILVYAQSTPQNYAVCCIEDSGLGDQAETVAIAGADGETLAGWYAPPSEARGPVILLLHGARGDRRGTLRHARVLREAGYGVLVYDQRASGESTGSRHSIGWYDARDITPIIDWLAARPEVDPRRIGAVGLSLGAHILVIAAPDEPRLAAVWADGLGINGGADLPPAADAGEAFINFVNQQAFWIGGLYLGVQPVPFRTLLPRIAPRPLMLVAGGRDPYDPGFARAYEGLLGENGGIWIIENAGHVGGLAAFPDEYAARMIAFFDAALR